MSLYFMGDARNCFGHAASVNSVHFQKDSNFIWTASTDKSARSFRVSSGGANKTLQSHRRGLSCITTDFDGSLVVTGGLDCAVVVTWTQQSANQAPLHVLAHDTALTSVTLDAGGDKMVTCSEDGVVMLWRVDAMMKLPRIKKFEMQNQMFEDEYEEYQASLKDHKEVCLRCCALVSSTKDLLNWRKTTPKKCDRIPSFSVSANAHDSVCDPCTAAGGARSKSVSCGIQRLHYFSSRRGLVCAAGRPGVAIFQIDETLTEHQ
jgi:WD40 repeat protein